MKKHYQNYDAVQLATDEDFIRWVKHPSPETDAAWESWLEAYPQKRAAVEEARVLVTQIKFQPRKPAVDTEQLWNRIQASKDEAGKVKAIGNRRRFLLGMAGSIAAAIALILFVVWGIDRPHRVSTAYEEHLAVNLPDGSEVQLNADSKLEYDEGGRRIKLQGEAFFAVQKGSSFVVETDLGKVEVLGTQFNVFSREGQFRVKCTEGRVQVTIPGSSEKVVLTPGIACALDGTGKLVVEQLSGQETEVAWLENIFRFKNQPLREVFAEMERQFGVDIEASETILAIEHVGAFEGTQLDSALFEVCYPHNLQSSIKGKKINITETDTE